MPRLNVGDKMPDFEFATPYSPAGRLSETVQKCPGKTALVFLRYYGCRMCQLDMIDYQEGYGAIAASLIAETVITVLYLIFCKGYLKVQTIVEEGWKKLAAGLLMLAVIKVLDRFIVPDFPALLAEVAVGLSVYCIVIAALHDTFLTEIVFGKIIGKRKKQ